MKWLWIIFIIIGILGIVGASLFFLPQTEDSLLINTFNSLTGKSSYDLISKEKLKIVKTSEPHLKIVDGADSKDYNIKINERDKEVCFESDKTLSPTITAKTDSGDIELTKSTSLDSKDQYCYTFDKEGYLKLNSTIVNQEESLVQFTEGDSQVNSTLKKWNGEEFVIAPGDIWIKNYKFGDNDTITEEDTLYQYEWISNKEIKKDSKGYYFDEEKVSSTEHSNIYSRTYLDTKDICRNVCLNETIINISEDNIICNEWFRPECSYSLDNNTVLVNFTGYYNSTMEMVFIDPSYNYSNVSTGATTSSNIRSELDFSHLALNDSSLVLYMPFDVEHGSDNITYDYSNNDNDFLVNGATINDSGVIGSGYNFDGSNDEMSISLSHNPTQNFSFSLWFKLDNAISGTINTEDELNSLVEKNNDWGLWFYNGDSGTLRFGSYGGNVQTTKNSWDAGVWYHVVCVYGDSDGSDMDIYVNGELDNSGSGDALAGNSDDLYLGYEYTQGWWFDGVMDEFIMFNRSLNVEEIRELYNYTNFTRFHQLGNQTFQATNLTSGYVKANITIKGEALNDSSLNATILESTDNSTFTESSSGVLELTTLNSTHVRATFDINSGSAYFKPVIYYISDGYYSPIVEEVEIETYEAGAVGDTTNPEVTLNSPSADATLSSNPVTFNCTASDNINLTNVTLYIDGVANETNSSGVNNSNYIFSKNINSGEHNWSCEAFDNSSNSYIAPNRSFTWETKSVTIERLLPSLTDNNYNATQNEMFQVDLNVTCQTGNCGTINVSLDPEIKTEYTPSTKTVCNKGVCTKTLYSGTTFVKEDEKWIKMEDAKSLKGTGISCVIDYDGVHEAECSDFKYNKETGKFDVDLDLYKNTLFDNVPIRVLSYNQTESEKTGKAEYTEVSRINKNFNLIASKDTVTVQAGFTDIIHFGDKSTTIILQDNITDNLGDAFVNENQGDTNHGSTTNLFIADYSTSVNSRYYIRFNVSSLFGKQLENAYYYHYRYDASSSVDVYLIELFENASWNESGITWNNQPCGSDRILGDFNNLNSSYCNTSYYDSHKPSSNGWHSLDLTGLANKTLNNGYNNFSFLITTDESYESGLIEYEESFYSKEYTTASLRPYLNITYIEETSPTKSGLIPVEADYDSGTDAFYTNASTNPLTTGSLNEGQSETITFWVNATGTVDDVFEFYAFANLTSDLSISNETDKWNVTIIEEVGTDSCSCPSSANWEIDLTDNCDIQDNCDITGYNISFINTGTITFNASITSCDIGDLPNNQRGYLGGSAKVSIGACS